MLDYQCYGLNTINLKTIQYKAIVIAVQVQLFVWTLSFKYFQLPNIIKIFFYCNVFRSELIDHMIFHE
jgi:hypothetical protein